MIINVMLDKAAYMPIRAHEDDAGWDLKSRDTKVIPAYGSAVFDTGVHMEIPQGYVGFLKSKSGLNIKSSLTGTGVIDAGYTGPIIVKMYNNGDTDYSINAGDKLIQIVILPIPKIEGLQLRTSFDDTDRGSNGFGSSGK